MTANGDPRTFDPELTGRLNKFEFWFAVRCFDLREQQGRLSQVGQRTESPASVARSVVLLGVWWPPLILITITTVLLTLMAVGYLVGLAAQLENVYRVLLILGRIVFGTSVLWVVGRSVYLNRLFVQGYRDDLRWFPWTAEFSVPVTDPDASMTSPQNRIAVQHARIRDSGDPRTIAPEVVARLSAWERAQIQSTLKRRLRQVGQGRVRHPDDEPARSVAQRVVLGAVGWIAKKVALTAGLVGLATLLIVVDRVDRNGDAWTGWAVIILGALTVMVLTPLAWAVRCWQMNRRFAEVKTPEVRATTTAGVDGAGGLGAQSSERPAIVEPRVWESLTPAEQRMVRSKAQSSSTFGAGLESVHESSVARELVIGAVTAAGGRVPMLVAMISGALMLVAVVSLEVTGWWIVWVLSLLVLVIVLARLRARRRHVNRVLDGASDPGRRDGDP